MESIRCSMNYENCSLICQQISPKPLDDKQSRNLFIPQRIGRIGRGGFDGLESDGRQSHHNRK